jgi:hypothetical protein
MKKTTVLLSIILLAGNLCYGQKCKYVKNEVDEFTKENTKITEAYLIDPLSGVGANMYFTNKNGNYTLTIWYSNGKINENLNVGITDTLMLRLDDESILKLPPEKPVEFNERNNDVWPIYLITKEQTEQLSIRKIAKVRFHFNGNALDYDISSKKSEKIMIAATCALQ